MWRRTASRARTTANGSLSSQPTPSSSATNRTIFRRRTRSRQVLTRIRSNQAVNRSGSRSEAVGPPSDRYGILDGILRVLSVAEDKARQAICAIELGRRDGEETRTVERGVDARRLDLHPSTVRYRAHNLPDECARDKVLGTGTAFRCRQGEGTGISAPGGPWITPWHGGSGSGGGEVR